MHNNHYDVINKMPFFARSYYCHDCKKAYNNLGDHHCANSCKCCRSPVNCFEVTWMPCNECHRLFKSQECYDQHKQRRGRARSGCESLVRCGECGRTVRRYEQAPSKHRCGLERCRICKTFVKLQGHKCFIQPENCSDEQEEEDNEHSLTELLFFDFECRRENGIHEPNLCIVQNEAGDEWIFEGDTTQNNFCERLFTPEHVAPKR